MFSKRKLEVVPEGQYTDFSDRLNEREYATKKTVIAACIPLAVAVPIVVSNLSSGADTYSAASIPVTAAIQPPPPIPATESVLNILAQTPTTIPVNMASPEVIQTGIRRQIPRSHRKCNGATD